MSGLDPNGGGPLVVLSGGGGTHGSGTLAARPASPAAGDTYAVIDTDPTAPGAVYGCVVAGTWALIAVTPVTLTDSSSGWALDAGDRGGAAAAAVAGGLCTLTLASGVTSPFDAGNGYHAPSATRALVWRSWRAEARLATVDTSDAGSRLGIEVIGGTTRIYVGVRGDSSAEASILGPALSVLRVVGAAIPTDGTGWCALEYVAGRLVAYYGTGVGTTRPADTAWVPLAAVDYTATPTPPPALIAIVCARYDTPTVAPVSCAATLTLYA